MNAATIEALFKEQFGHTPQMMIQAPGRINLIGEHTDYNNGLVLPAAINKYTWFAISFNESSKVRFWAANLSQGFEGESSHLEKTELGWVNYLLGILDQFQRNGTPVSGIDCVFGGNLPVGAGMSASAALETGFAMAINEHLGTGFSRPEIAKLAMQASHSFSEIPCGIMDQFAVLMGQDASFFKLDCRSLEYEYFPADLGDYTLVLIDSKVKHALVDSAYVTRVEECRSGVSAIKEVHPAVHSLRDVTVDMLQIFAASLDPVVYRRCQYVVTENDRVLQTTQALQEKHIESVGELLLATHKGLRDDYEVSCPEIDLLVDFAIQFPGAIGSRIMGGGFGGCTLNLVKKEVETSFILEALAHYKAKTGVEGIHHSVDISSGVTIL